MSAESMSCFSSRVERLGRMCTCRAEEFPASMEKATDIRHFRLQRRSWKHGKSNSLLWKLQSRAPWNGNAADEAFTSATQMEICWSWPRREFGRPTDGGIFYCTAPSKRGVAINFFHGPGKTVPLRRARHNLDGPAEVHRLRLGSIG